MAVEKIPRDMSEWRNATTNPTQLTPWPSDNISSSHPATINNLYKRELPDSQGSVLSSVSNTFATTPALHSSSSNVSNSTTVDTDFTSPFSSKPSSQNQLLDPPIAPSPAQFRSQNVHPAPSRIDTTSAPRTGDTAASPMSLDSPVLAQGSKRTASGAVKGLGLSLDGATTATAATTNAHKRTKSTDTGANPRIGEVCIRQRRVRDFLVRANASCSYPRDFGLDFRMPWSRSKTGGRNSRLKNLRIKPRSVAPPILLQVEARVCQHLSRRHGLSIVDAGRVVCPRTLIR